jgi:hypothetical protein
MASRAGEKGITVAELRDTNLHHGRISGALSVLHKEGRLARLAESRDKCRIYVLPQFVNDRRTEKHGVVHKADKETLEAAAMIEARLRKDEDYDALFDLDPADDGWTKALWTLVNYAQGRI